MFEFEYSNAAKRQSSVKLTVTVTNPYSSWVAYNNWVLELDPDMFHVPGKVLYPGRTPRGQVNDFTVISPNNTFVTKRRGQPDVVHVTSPVRGSNTMVKMHADPQSPQNLVVSMELDAQEAMLFTVEAVVDNDIALSKTHLTCNLTNGLGSI